jgi:hypothetical protein
MQIAVERKDGKSMWLSTNYQALNDYFKHRKGEDIELAKLLFPNFTEEELNFITGRRNK